MSHSRDALPSPSDNVPAPPTETEPPVNPDGASPSVTTTDSNEDAETGNTENEDPENGPSPEDAETGSTENEDPESEPSPEDAEIEETETGGAPDETAETTGTTDDAAPAPVPMMVDYDLMPDPVVPPSEWDNAVGVVPESVTTRFLTRPSGAGASLSPLSSRRQDQLRRRLGLKPGNWVLEQSVRINGWIATGVVTLIAALTRLIGLGHPDRLMFDEIYYVKDAYALWHNGYESVWSDNADELFAKGNFSALTLEPAYVVHPQLGKWLIGLGMEIFGPGNPFGWRFIPAVAGILTVFLLARLTMRLTHSPLLAGLAGFLLAIDGTGITESRIGLLDIFIGFFSLLSIYCLVRDREWFRARLATGLDGTYVSSWAPLPLMRPWLLATGVSLGLTCSIKWSGAYLLAGVGILTVVWDLTALHRIRARSWFLDGILHRGVLDFLHLVPVALVVYVLGWWSWFMHARAFDRNWAATHREAGELVRSWLPDSLNSLLEYHLSMYNFHTHLEDPHPYMSKPIQWLVQWRPTSFYWPDERELAGTHCGTGKCVQAITSIGNIPVWWSAVIGLIFCVLVLALRNRDWRAWVALIGYVGLYLPWFIYQNRTIFGFYTVAFVPFVVLALTLWLGAISGLIEPVPGSRLASREDAALASGSIGENRPYPRGFMARLLGFGGRPTRRGLPAEWTGVPAWRTRAEGLWVLAAVVIAATIFAVLWWPIWTGQTVSYDFWHWHMLLPSWV